MATLTEFKSDAEHYFIDENGQKQGEYKSWYSNGQLREHGFFVDGKLHGEFKWWHENGHLYTHCFYVDGKRHGEYKWWHDNGQLCVHCYYADGNMVIDFLKEPDLCPVTDEVKTYFALKCGWTKWL
jgi:antitoxin component YwqK of YwqJK toxin-antitoxin module